MNHSALVVGKIVRQIVSRKPIRLANLETAGRGHAYRFAREINLNLARPGQGSDKEKLNVVNFQSHLFAQFSADGVVRLFSFV